VPRAEVVRQRGTNRAAVFRQEANRYVWLDQGSNYSLSDIAAAVLFAQLEHAEEITAARRRIWRRYHEAFAATEEAGLVKRPTVPSDVESNAHVYYLLLPSRNARDRFIERMKARDIVTPFHFLPLDASPAGRRLARAHGSLAVTHAIADRLVRLPIWFTMESREQEVVIEAALAELDELKRDLALDQGAR
jgi:dTDP-4-amino-4,6-dideoxygalactose transaminase